MSEYKILTKVFESAETAPHKIAVVSKNSALTYHELAGHVLNVSKALVNAGITSDHVVCTLLDNSIENVIVFLALMNIGAMEAAIPMEWQENAILAATDCVSATFLITNSRKSCGFQNNIPGRIKVLLVENLFSWQLNETTSTQKIAKAKITCKKPGGLIQFTSGTTGHPKAAVLDETKFIYVSRKRARMLSLDHYETNLICVPLSHSCGKSLLFDIFFYGGTMVLIDGFKTPSIFLKTLLENRVSIVTGPPMIFQYLTKLQKQKDILSKLVTHLKILEIGLSRTTPDLFMLLRNVFPWATLVNRYGVTECAGAAALRIHTPGKMENPESCGSRDTMITSVSIANASMQENRYCGAVRLSGPAVMHGYLGDLKKTNGTFITEDIGAIDKDGNFFIVGRSPDLLKVAGNRFSPDEVEKTICQFNAISDVVVFGLHGDSNDHIICIYNARENCTDDLMKYCRIHLPAYMIPKSFIFEPVVTWKSPTGKVNRKALQQYHSDLVQV